MDTTGMMISADLDHFSGWGLFSAYSMPVLPEIVHAYEEFDLTIKQIPGAAVFFSLRSGATAPVGKPEIPSGTAIVAIDAGQPFPLGKGKIANTAGKSIYTAPSIIDANSPSNKIRIRGSLQISPNQVYHMTQEISLGVYASVTVDGKTYFFNFRCDAVTNYSDGISILDAAHPGTDNSYKDDYGLSLGWTGTGVGRFAMGGGPDAFGASGRVFYFEDTTHFDN